MSRNVVTTELVADQPLVIVLHHDEKIAQSLAAALSQKQLQVESYSVTEMLHSAAILDRVIAAYKVIWVTNPKQYLENEAVLRAATATLSPFQQKLTVLLPIFTTFAEEVPGEVPNAVSAFQVQTDCILFFNQLLPQVMFLFGQDILDVNVEYSSLSLFTQNLQKGLIYSPKISFHPQTINSFIQRVCRYFLQPQRSSVLIRGNSVMAPTVCEEIKTLYQSYYFSPVEIQEAVVTPTSPIPFSVIENFVTDSIASAVQQYVQSFPTPKSRFVSFSWQKAQFNQKTEKSGVEVDPMQTLQAPHVEEESLVSDQIEPTDHMLSTLAAALQPRKITRDVVAAVNLPPAHAAPEDSPEIVATPVPPKPQAVQFDLNQEIQRVFSDSHITNKKKQTQRIEQKKIVVQKKTKKRTALFYGGLAFTGMGLGVLSLAIVFMITVNMFRSALSSFITTQVLAQEDHDLSWDKAQLTRVQRLESLIALQVDSYSALFSLPALQEAETLVGLSAQLPAAEEQNRVLNDTLKTFYSQLTGLDSGDSIATAEKLTIEALTAREKLGALESQLQSSMMFLKTPADQSAALDSFSQVIAEEKLSVQVLQQIQPIVGQLLGQDRKRTYAFILQNNQELRPTGGFIEDVALLTFQNGTLVSTKVLSGYQVDKQLAGTVVPPQEISSYLREADWNFIDSNWDPHFPKSAEQISWFLEKSLGTTVDGVITIDLYGIANILEATGPLDLPDYNEVLTDKNIFDQFEFHSEVSLVDNNKDYKQVVFDALVAKITTLPPDKAGALFSSLRHSFDKQHMLASFADADELQTMKNLGWSGSLLQPNCPAQFQTQNCVVDTIAQVEANVGTNTANHYLKRSIDHEVAFSASAAAHVRTITFENTAQSDAWPKGPYQVFTRLYLPLDAEVGSVLIDGAPIKKTDLIFQEENNRSVVGFYAEVPIKSSKKIVVSYSVPITISPDIFAYTFFEQQQPGSGLTPYSLQIDSPPDYSPTIIAPQAEVQSKVITFKKQDVGHGFFGARFEK